MLRKPLPGTRRRSGEPRRAASERGVLALAKTRGGRGVDGISNTVHPRLPVAVGPDLARIRSSSSPSRQAGARGSSAAPRWRAAGRREHDAARRRGSGRSPGESVRRAAPGTSTVVSCDTMASTSRTATCRAPRRRSSGARSPYLLPGQNGPARATRLAATTARPSCSAERWRSCSSGSPPASWAMSPLSGAMQLCCSGMPGCSAPARAFPGTLSLPCLLRVAISRAVRSAGKQASPSQAGRQAG